MRHILQISPKHQVGATIAYNSPRSLPNFINRPWVAIEGTFKLTKRLLYLTGVWILVVFGLTQPARASTITFDQAITPGANASVESNPFIAQYQPPPQPGPNPDAFRTQGFTFGGYTPPVTSGRTDPELIIVLDALMCPANIGVACATANDNSDFLLAGDPFSMFIGGGVNFSLTGFDATGFFPQEGCPLYIEDPLQPEGPPLQLGCDDQEVIFPAQFVKVVGVTGANVVLATQISPLTSDFASIALTDPAWANIAKAIVLPVDAQGNRVERYLAIDNINATAVPTAVPEPASLLLLTTGLAGAGVRRWRKR